ncbi:hypothetical protein ACOMHN_007880 [Nucella lapillus]
MAYRYPTTSSTSGSRGHDHYNGQGDHRQGRYSSSSSTPTYSGGHNYGRYNRAPSDSSSGNSYRRYPSASSYNRSSHNDGRSSSSSYNSRHSDGRYSSNSSYNSSSQNDGRYTSTPSHSSSQNDDRYTSSSSYKSSSQDHGRPSTTGDSSSHGDCGRSSSSGQRAGSFSSGSESGYTSPGYTSPVLSPTTFRYAQSPPPQQSSLSPAPSPTVKLYDVNSNPREQTEHERSVEYHQAPDTFPCGHVLCHLCLRKFIKSLGGPARARCPVCHIEVSGEDVSLASMGLPTEHQEGEGEGEGQGQGQRQQEAPISLLSNYDEIVKKFNGLQNSLRRLKDESVQSRSMGMTYTNTVCHLCRQAHPTLRVIQEHNQLEVCHERPPSWRSQYYYRLQQGKVVTTFYSKVNAATICVPCTYRELRESKAILPPDVHEALPDVDPGQNQQLALAEVGKIMAKNTAPLMALKGKNVVEVDHKIRVKERADHFHFTDTAQQIEQMVRSQEENLLRHATKQIRDTGQLYHVQESNEVEVDNDETLV